MLKTLLLNPLFNALLLIYAILPGRDFGVAVIVLTILIRILLWPLVKKQLHHHKAMKELQPEIAKLKKKAAGDRQKESVMMMELFKEKEINPFGSLGLALLQFPILITLFFVLRQIVDPAKVVEIAYPFVAKLGPIQGIITDPSSFHPSFLGLVDMAQPSLVLAAAAGLAQYFQAKQITPQNMGGSDAVSRLGFNMTLIFPVITVAIASTLPSALALYWAASSLMAIIQQQAVLSEEVKWLSRLTRRKGSKNEKSK